MPPSHWVICDVSVHARPSLERFNVPADGDDRAGSCADVTKEIGVVAAVGDVGLVVGPRDPVVRAHAAAAVADSDEEPGLGFAASTASAPSDGASLARASSEPPASFPVVPPASVAPPSLPGAEGGAPGGRRAAGRGGRRRVVARASDEPKGEDARERGEQLGVTSRRGRPRGRSARKSSCDAAPPTSRHTILGARRFCEPISRDEARSSR